VSRYQVEEDSTVVEEPDLGPPELQSLDLDVFLSEEPPAPRWQWVGYYARGDVVLVAGDAGTGKSMLCLSNAAQAALGGGEQLAEEIAGGRALFVDLENPDDVVHARLHAFGITGNVEGLDYVWRPLGFDLLGDGGIENLRSKIVATGAEAVYIDSLRRAVPGLDENDSRMVGLLLSMLRDLARELDVTIVVIHHARKPTGDAKLTALAAARGSGDLTASVDSYLYFRRLAGGLIQVEHGKARRGREHAKEHFRVVDDEGAPRIERVDVTVRKPGTAERLRELRAAEPNITQAEAAIALGLGERTVPGVLAPGGAAEPARGAGRVSWPDGPRFVVADSAGSPALVLDRAWCFRVVARFASSRYGSAEAARQKAAPLALELNKQEQDE
jgi:AAA domain